MEFKERAAYEKGFTQHYNEKIRPALNQLEELRIEQRKIFVKRRSIFIPIAPVLVIGGIVLDGMLRVEEPTLTWAGIGLAVTIWGAWVSAPLRKFKSNVKAKIMPVVCSFFGNLNYIEKRPITKDEIKKYIIFPGFTSMQAEDFVSGSHDDLKLDFHELLLKRKQNKSTVTVFRGIKINVQFPKPFKGRTVVRKDAGRFLNYMNRTGNLDRLELEDPKFEKLFEAYSTDQIEGRYLLTTAFMERLISLKEAFGGSQMQCEFFEDKLVIALASSKNLFEPRSIKKSILDLEDIHIFLKELNELFELLRLLKLNRV